MHSFNRFNTSLVTLLVATLLLTSSACRKESTDPDGGTTDGGTTDAGTEDAGTDGGAAPQAVAELLDSSEGASVEAALVATAGQAAAESGATTDEGLAEAAAQVAIDTPTVICSYGGTASASVSGNTVTYTFDNCSNHCGMHRATGTVDVTYTFGPTAIGIELSTTDLQVDLATITVEASADYSLAGTTASYSIASDTSVAGPMGNSLTFRGAYDVSFDAAAACIEQSGSVTWGGPLSRYTVTLEDYRRCALECPQAGSKLTYVGPAGYTASVEFVSDDMVQWSDSRGNMGTVSLGFCGG